VRNDLIKERQYRFAAPANPQKFPVNCRLYTVRSSTAVETALIGGILNSSFVTLSTLLFGRPVGIEANWSTMVSDTEMMLVPDWNSGDQSTKQRVAKAFTAMCERKILGYLSEHRSRRTALLQKGRIDKLAELSDETELGQSDRHELDDAVLQILGIREAAKRKLLRERLYDWLEEYFETAKRKEEHAIANKAIAKRQAKLTPQALASDVFALIEKENPALLKVYRDIAAEDANVPKEGVRVPNKGTPEIVDDLLMTGVRFRAGKGQTELVRTRSVEQARLLIKIFELGSGGRNHLLPIETSVILNQIKRIDALLKTRRAKVRELIEARTSDAEIRRKAFELVMARFK
jgi:hypothetical protein